MKTYHLLLIAALAVLMLSPGYAQDKKVPSKQQETAQTNTAKAEQATNPPSTPNAKKAEGFLDQNGDGIDDRAMNTNASQKRARTHKRDQFIDTDGDGINDTRCNGLGFGCSQKCQRKRGGRN